ncbi:hypothetical protein SAMD00079811_20900 [Scytonema sp. HK-05]|uniref:CHAT domain-containing protein n=1 Tax=Scytonema sp. HK-05 TaxID=1137095 RepID=UPI000935DCA4|nr:CHAT domain-containing protein [Scytonema sp. HK-05]OKH53172.1 hypothetical protein NIES2130_30850 [Scytonema sp. HK-05]BAY44490.1 hypothetical protein SAMD00079811_20900 [Scytonema sp. HK-05]
MWQELFKDFVSKLARIEDPSSTLPQEHSSEVATNTYLNFLLLILQATEESDGNEQVVYPLLQTNLDKLDDNLIQLLQKWVMSILSEVESDKQKHIARVTLNFSLLIQNFPLDSKELNKDIAIAGYKIALKVYTRSSFLADWARIQENLGVAYLERSKGETAENLEQAIAAFDAALEVYTCSSSPEDWARTQAYLGIAYLYRSKGEKAENLEQVIAAFDAALEVYTCSSSPENWARTQAYLGNAYLYRSKGEKAENLEQAIAAFDAALEVYTCSSSPEGWARTQVYLGIAYTNRIKGKTAKNLEQAIAAFRDALEVYTRSSSSKDWARTQNNLGVAYTNRIKGKTAKNLEQAIAAFDAALEVYTRSSCPEDWAMTQVNLGIAYLERIKGEIAENLEQAIAAFDAALEVYTRSSFPENWARTQVNLGIAYSYRIKGETAENLEQAIATFNAALEVYTRSSSPEDWAMTQVNLGIAYLYRIKGDKAENLEQAIAAFRDALEVYTSSSPEDWAKTQVNLGIAYLYRIKGDKAENIEQAITAFHAALEVYTSSFPISWAMTQHNLGIAYLKRIEGEKAENIEQAITAFHAALKICTRSSFRNHWAMTQNELGIAYRERIKGEKAENIEQAIAAFHAALKICTRSSFPNDWARIQNELGIVYRDKKQISKAIQSFRLALKIYTPTAFPIDCLKVGRNLGQTAFQAKLWFDAIEGYDAAIRAIEQSCEWVSSEAKQQKLRQDGNDVYTCIVQACVNNHQVEKAIEYVERGKARTLVELLANRNLNPKGDVPPEVLEKLQRVKQEIRAKQQRLETTDRNSIEGLLTSAKIQTTSNAYSSNSGAIKLRQELNELQSQREQVLEQIQRIDPSYQLTQRVQPISFREICDSIDNHTAIIAWYITSERFFTFVITHQNAPYVWQSSSNDLKTLKQWWDEYLNDYNTLRGDKENSQWQAKLTERLDQLSAILHLDEIVSQIPQVCKQLILIPHRYLHLFPLHALPIKRQASHLLIEENRRLTNPTNVYYLLDFFPGSVRYAPSCQLLQQVEKREYIIPNSPRFFAIQNPTKDLGFADVEVQTIERVFKPNSHIFKNEKATKAALNQTNLRDIHYTHFSCHGLFNFNSPLRSALILAESVVKELTPATATECQPWYNGKLLDTQKCLTLQDIFEQMELPHCHLVTLSACETGLTDFKSLSDEYIGFASGFLYAGSLCVVCTLWKVDDFATAFLMIKFYHNLQHLWGKSAISKAKYPIVAQALNEAQHWLRQVTKPELHKWIQQLELDEDQMNDIELRLNLYDEQPFVEPKYWAAFCTIGR